MTKVGDVEQLAAHQLGARLLRAHAEDGGRPAVRGLQPADIAAALAERLGHAPSQEQAAALAQVQRIAELRIDLLVAP